MNESRETNLRPCEVDGRKALFHKWTEVSKIIPPSPMIGGHGGGVVTSTLGIVEYEDGTVGTVYPERIKFTDRMRDLSSTTSRSENEENE